MVVSSETPMMSLAMVVQCCGLVSTERARTRSTSLNSSLSVLSCDGTTPVFSYSTPRCRSIVMSPPSSSSTLGPTGLPSVSVKSKTFSASSQYSASDSPFQAKTGVPAGASTVPSRPTTTAAAAWSWVEKMLQVAQRTSAPRSTRVSMSTAVWIVMCSEPAMRAPARGWSAP